MKEQGKKSSKNTLYEQGCYLVDSKLPYFENQLIVPSKYTKVDSFLLWMHDMNISIGKLANWSRIKAMT